MSTKNRRIATYLPESLDRSLSSFKQEKGLKGDSAALIAILESFFGVTQEVSQNVALELTQKIEALESKIDSVGDLSQSLETLGNRVQVLEAKALPLHQIKTEIADELLSELKGDLSSAHQEVAGQLKLIPDDQGDLIKTSHGESENEPKSDLLHGLSARDLEKRFKQKEDHGQVSRSKIGSLKNTSDFPAWSVQQDPQGIAWEYRENKFYPLRELLSDSLSNS
jgi:hypothetical protein